MNGLPRRAVLALALLGMLLLAAPFIVNAYILSILILVLYYAYAGQSWNIMMGFAGQLSLGHSLYVGVGAYAAAGLFVHFGISPWAGALLSVLCCTALGAIVGFLAFRFGIAGVYFAILTIAFAEFTRVGFDHWHWLGSTGGLFLPVKEQGAIDLENLRGPPILFYYLILFLCIGALGLCHWLLHSKPGYYWQAIRENEEAAQALGINTFAYKMIAVMLSSAMTSLAGVFFAFYYNNLFPEQIFSMTRSIEIILGPIIGGLGTLIGPILGAFVLTPLAEGITELIQWLGIEVPGVKQVFYGVSLLLVVMFLPNGIWPSLARMFGMNAKH